MSAALALPEVSDTTLQLRPSRSASNEVVLYGVATLLMFCPLAFGAVEPWAIFTLQSASAILFVVWAIGQLRSAQVSILWSPVFPPMLAFMALICIQLLPGISAYRHATYSGLLLYIAYGLACFLLTQTLTRTTHIRRLATAFVIYGTWMAMFAALQGLSSTSKLYWLRTPRFGGWIYGPYVNHNHYAGLMEMLVPIPLVFAFSRYAHGRQRWAAASAAAFMGATIFLSGSRGGMVAFAVQVAIFLWFLFTERTGGRAAFLMAAFLLLSLASIAWIGGSEVTARLSTISASKHSDLANDIRFQINRGCRSPPSSAQDPQLAFRCQRRSSSRGPDRYQWPPGPQSCGLQLGDPRQCIAVLCLLRSGRHGAALQKSPRAPAPRSSRRRVCLEAVRFALRSLGLALRGFLASAS